MFGGFENSFQTMFFFFFSASYEMNCPFLLPPHFNRLHCADVQENIEWWLVITYMKCSINGFTLDWILMRWIGGGEDCPLMPILFLISLPSTPQSCLIPQRKVRECGFTEETRHCKTQHSVGKVLLNEGHQTMGKFLVQLVRTSMGIKFLWAEAKKKLQNRKTQLKSYFAIFHNVVHRKLN